MIVDNSMATVGSANLSNRSMFFDSECNIVLDATNNPAASSAIAHFRHRLLAEHLGCDPARVASVENTTGSLHAVLDIQGNGQRFMKPLPQEPATSSLGDLPATLVADPERPLGLEGILDYLGFEEEG